MYKHIAELTSEEEAFVRKHANQNPIECLGTPPWGMTWFVDRQMLEGLTEDEQQKFSAVIKTLREEMNKNDGGAIDCMDMTIDNYHAIDFLKNAKIGAR